MSRNVKHTVLFGLAAAVILTLTGCICIGCFDSSPSCKSKLTKTVSTDMTSDILLTAQTSNGNIHASAWDAGLCEVQAHITARGNSEQEAAEIAERVQIKLAQTDTGLVVEILKPESELSKYISVSLDLKLPAQNSLNLKTSNGNIDVDGIGKDITLSTSNGNITSNKTPGPAAARTSNGNVNCRDIQKDMIAKSSNGNISISYDKTAGAAHSIDLETSNGSITLDAPEQFSAKVDASTSNGRVTTDRPITVQGTISKNSLNGTIGSGEGNCRLHTSNGSIHIR